MKSESLAVTVILGILIIVINLWFLSIWLYTLFSINIAKRICGKCLLCCNKFVLVTSDVKDEFNASGRNRDDSVIDTAMLDSS